MSILQVLLAKSLNQLQLAIDLGNFLVKLHQHIVFLALTELHLHCHVLSLQVLHILDKFITILLEERLKVPFVQLITESVSVVPQLEFLIVANLEQLNLFDLSLFSAKNIFVFLVLLNFVAVAIKLLLDFSKFREGLSGRHLLSSENFIIELINLLANVGLLLINLGGERVKIGVSVDLSLDVSLLQFFCERLNFGLNRLDSLL